MATPSSIEDYAAEWESLVGKAILRFGDIELISIKCLAIIPTDSIGLSVAKLDFSRRAELLVEILEVRDELDEHLRAVLVGFKRALQLASTRNLIAHNPLMLDLFVNEDETEFKAEHSIKSARTGNTSLDLAELKEFAAEVDELSSQLWHKFLEYLNHSDELWRDSK